MHAMTARPRLLVAIVICFVLAGWWAASGFPIVSARCKQTHSLTLFYGPFSSLCYHSLFSHARFDLRQLI
jgi:hypothetical protein